MLIELAKIGHKEMRHEKILVS